MNCRNGNLILTQLFIIDEKATGMHIVLENPIWRWNTLGAKLKIETFYIKS